MTLTRWPMRRLGDLAEFRNGINYNQTNFGSGIPVVGVKDFQNYTKPRYEELEEVNPDGIITEQSLLRDGDILFVRSNGNRELIGRSLYIDAPPRDTTHSAFTIRLRFRNTDLVARFYAYLFRTALIRSALTLHGGGTNISNLNQGILSSLLVPTPPRATQERITSLLAAYDDLMENNRRRVHVLEEMALAVYREWFVEFRFPGYQNVAFVPTPAGRVPEGWFAEFSALATIGRDGITPSEQPTEEFDHYSIPAFDDGMLPKAELGSSILSGKYLFDSRAVLVSKLNPRIPRVWLPRLGTGRRAISSTELLVLVPREPISREYLYLKCRSADFQRQFAALASGTSTSHQRVQPTSLLALPTAAPPRELVDSFTRLVAPVLELAYNLRVQISTLRRTRDLLLPGVFSGQLNLEKIEPAA